LANGRLWSSGAKAREW